MAVSARTANKATKVSQANHLFCPLKGKKRQTVEEQVTRTRPSLHYNNIFKVLAQIRNIGSRWIKEDQDERTTLADAIPPSTTVTPPPTHPSQTNRKQAPGRNKKSRGKTKNGHKQNCTEQAKMAERGHVPSAGQARGNFCCTT